MSDPEPLPQPSPAPADHERHTGDHHDEASPHPQNSNINHNSNEIQMTEEEQDPMDQLFFADPDDDDDNTRHRQGTIASARFNMWSTMVGGGCLSLPLAFSKMGNALGGPLLLIVTARVTEFCFTALVQSARWNHPPVGTGRDTYPGLAAAAAAHHSAAAVVYRASTWLVTLMCFFGIVGYAVLLRDLLEPVTDAVFAHHHPVDRHTTTTTTSPAWQDNLVLWSIVIVVTPLCTLPTLTALQPMGAASMCAIALLGVCITYRSLQCTLGVLPHHNNNNQDDKHDDDDDNNNNNYHWWDGFQLFPNHWKDVLDVLPLFISCFVCHYNIPVVHNELQQPTVPRVQWWLQSTVWGATLFYMVLGIAGSAYQPCTLSTTLHGNILLDFDAHDPLLLLGRLSLAVTIALAFPMLTIPARDIVLSATRTCWFHRRRHQHEPLRGHDTLTAALLEEPLLDGAPPSSLDVESDPDPVAPEPLQLATTTATATFENEVEFTSPATTTTSSLGRRLAASILVLWTGVAVASFVSSIDVVWDLLGSSFSMILSFLIPCATYWILSGKQPQQQQQDSRQRMLQQLQRGAALTIAVVSVPLMIASTINAVYDTFWNY